MAGTVKIPGIEHDFGGTIYIIPPLSLGSLEQLQKRLEALQTETNPLAVSSIGTIVDAAHAALRRNYPSITREEVADHVDVSNMHEVFQKVMDVAGLARKEHEAKKQAGAATPPLPPAPSPSAT